MVRSIWAFGYGHGLNGYLLLQHGFVKFFGFMIIIYFYILNIFLFIKEHIFGNKMLLKPFHSFNHYNYDQILMTWSVKYNDI